MIGVLVLVTCVIFMRLEGLINDINKRLKENPVSTVQDAAFELNAIPCVFSVRKSESCCEFNYYSGLTDGETFKTHRTNAGSLVFDLKDIYTFAHAEQAIKQNAQNNESKI